MHTTLYCEPDADPRSCNQILRYEELREHDDWELAYVMSHIPLISLEGSPLTQEEFDAMCLEGEIELPVTKKR